MMGQEIEDMDVDLPRWENRLLKLLAVAVLIGHVAGLGHILSGVLLH